MVTSSGPRFTNNEAQHPLFAHLKENAGKVQKIFENILDGDRQPAILYEASRHLTTAGGKMLRPFLAVKSCEVVGGREEDALPSAAAVELLHTFTLVHDDIMDNDTVRRGVPTVHIKWNIPIAIIAGDLLFSKVYETILRLTNQSRINPERLVRVIDEMTKAAIVVCEGQVLDISYPHMEKITEEDYVEMIGKKTSHLFRSAAKAGGIVGGGTDEQIEHLGNYAQASGLGFQIVDDLLGLTSTEEKLGKPIDSDLREGKKTLPVIHALQNATSNQRRKLLRNLGRKLTKTEVIQTRELIESIGSIDYATKRAYEYVAHGRQQLEYLPNNEARKTLTELAELLIARNF